MSTYINKNGKPAVRVGNDASDPLNVNIVDGMSVTVGDLDIGAVQINDGDDQLAINEDGSINSVPVDAAGQELFTPTNPGNIEGAITILEAIPAGSNLIGLVKLSDGTDVVAVNTDGSLNFVPINTQGAELFTNANPGKISGSVSLSASLPAGTNVIGTVKLYDGTDALAINSNGSINVVHINGSGVEMFTSTTPGIVDLKNGLPASTNVIGYVKISDGTDVLSITPSGLACIVPYSYGGAELFTSSNPGRVSMQSAIPAGSNLIGSMKLSDGTDTLLINTNGSVNIVPVNTSGVEIFTNSNPGYVKLGDSESIIGTVKLSDGADALVINSDGSLNTKVVDETGAQVFTSLKPAYVQGNVGINGTVNVAGNVGVTGMLPSGTNVIGYVKVSDGTDIMTINAGGSINAVPKNSSGAELFTVANPGHVIVDSGTVSGGGGGSGTSNAVQPVDIQGILRVEVINTTSLVAAGNKYTSGGIDAGIYRRFHGYCKTDQAGSLSIQISADGNTWHTWQTIGVTANNLATFDLYHIARYVRAEFTNTSGAAQTYFALVGYVATN